VCYEHADAEQIDYAWKEICSFAESVLADKYPQDCKEPGKKKTPKLTRSMSSRYAYTRSVSREDYDRQNAKNLFDMASPLFVMDEFFPDSPTPRNSRDEDSVSS
jgi:tyrosine decarboxylase